MAPSKLSDRQTVALRAVAWGTEHFGALVAGGETQKRIVAALARKGLVEGVGDVLVCDGDGFAVHPERYRPGWRITAAGKKALADIDGEAAQ